MVRVIDGGTLETIIDRKQVGVGVLGIEALAFGTPCGDAARATLQGLVGRGAVLRDAPENVVDARKRRMYQVSTPDGRSVAAEMVAAGPARVTGQLQAQYFPNMTLTGTAIVQRCERPPATGRYVIDYNWALAAPASGMPSDHFSVRWGGRFTFEAGTYEFQLTSDDGARLYVDDALVVNDWVDSSANTATGTTTLTAGEHTIRVEFYDNAWDAVIRLTWANTQPTATPTQTRTPTPTATSPHE